MFPFLLAGRTMLAFGESSFSKVNWFRGLILDFKRIFSSPSSRLNDFPFLKDE